MQKMKKILSALVFAVMAVALLIQPSSVAAQLQEGETAGNCGALKCLEGQTKEQVFGAGGANICVCKGSEVFGTIEVPAGVAQYNAASPGGIGIVLFISNLIRIATIIAGVWVMINFILAGWAYIASSGDSKAHSEASTKMTFSLIGLALIVGAYTLAAIVGLVFFGDASYILSPTIVGVGG